MSGYQQSVYEQCISRYDKQQDGEYDLIQLYIDLRKVANHPLLLSIFVYRIPNRNCVLSYQTSQDC